MLKDVIFNLRDLDNRLRETFIDQFGYLKPLINNYQKTSLTRYIRGHGNILMFIPCFEDSDLIKLSDMFKSLAIEKDLYIIENMKDG